MRAIRLFGLIAGVLLTHWTEAQRFDIKGVELDGEQVNIYYDLVDTNPANTYTVSVFSSKDNFISTLSKLSGDHGLEVRPGTNKKITWRAKEELGPDFEGKVSLEVRGRIYIPFIKLDDFQKNFKRGRPTEISWTGGSSQNVLNFELYKGDEKVESYPPRAQREAPPLYFVHGSKAGKRVPLQDFGQQE